jgi:hypothetical protein
MGQDYNPKPIPDPRYWAECSCGEFRAYGRDLDGAIDLLKLHANINKDTHYAGGGHNSYFLHVPSKPNWYRRIFGAHKGTDK